MRYNWFSSALKLLNRTNSNRCLLTNGRSLSNATQSDDTSSNPAQLPPQESTKNINKSVDQQMSLHIAVIGVPNVGKSTFINNIINHRVCPTSAKVHTTRKSNTAICTTGQTQLVFYDTPGLVTQREIRKHHLEQSFKSSYRHAIQHADVIAVMQDVSNSWTRKELHPTVLDTLKAYANLPSFLVLNKIDALKSKRVLLDLIKTLTNDTLSGQRNGKGATRGLAAATTGQVAEGIPLSKRQTTWDHFDNVFLVSAMTGNGLNELQNYLIGQALPRQWRFASDIHTDASPEALIVESVRARLLDYLPQEIPYNLKCELEYYSLEKHVVYTSVQVQCPTERIERLICGESNGKLRQITERVTSDLVEMFGQAVSLTISTASKVK
ncbi:GL11028 [Drosophila persimilis]|uniref:GTPase Era, mitochondrial n=2 Tax=pseudoobscura subgroup TaxID=32358 RepID=A0A6I8V3Y9_DROPS|nr:GTPase Era, mitochondrial [Drosophila persimilis]XP_002138128.2 GTPase Era, mitochondrial [Drosophila pseudoobscura]EDW31319.1 GL11028 [Drosophila persimilis]